MERLSVRTKPQSRRKSSSSGHKKKATSVNGKNEVDNISANISKMEDVIMAEIYIPQKAYKNLDDEVTDKPAITDKSQSIELKRV